MVKKKRQSDPSENGDESTESCDETAKSACPHVGRAVELAKIKRALKTNGFEKECAECKKITKTEVEDPDYEEDLTLWLCLRCGVQLCGRKRNKHALNHYNTPHSDLHALTANTTTWEIYCYNCDNEVSASSSKKLHECIEYMKKQANSNPKLPPIELPLDTLGPKMLELTMPLDTVMRNDKGKDKATGLNLYRVRGLTNLGNTCFFNSVMQCLVQTPYLLNVLQEMSNPGERFTLPGGKLKFKGEQNDDSKEMDLPPITGKLAEWGALTRTLAETVAELQAGEGGVYTPRKLLSALVTKLPQFGGGDQHDAHELLRHLLEAVRSEDLRRYQSVILSSLGMSSKVDPARVDGEVKQKVKFYGQQASDTMLRPEQVFRGFLVSTLECQECFHQSDRAEYFLDLSLPVATSRPQPPALVRRKTPNDENLYNPQEENKPSKHQLKKERIAAKRAARKNKGNSTANDKLGGDANGAKEDGKSSSEQSDADVEDNLEDLPRTTNTHSASVGTQATAHTAANFAAYHMESGYNSEKVISSDSIRTSPIDLDKEKTDNTPESTDKDKEFAEATTNTDIALEHKPLIPLENFSNPDSGVASPEATKHNSTETVDNVNDSPLNGKELGSHSSLSSEMNLDLSSPQHNVLSPIKSDFERPVSRISFAPEYSNEVVSRGISHQGSRDLFENSWEFNGTRTEDMFQENNQDAESNQEVTNKLEELKLDMDADIKPKTTSPVTTENALEPPPMVPRRHYTLKYNRRSRGQANDELEKTLDRADQSYSSHQSASPRYVCDEDECSIQSCLSQFTALELLTGNNKVGCETCTERINGKDGKTVYTNATKRFLVSSPPAILILHLKRFQIGPRCMFRKMSKHVDFPTIFDLAPFCAMDKLKKLPNVARGQNELLYSLYGIVEHSGGMHGGHYVAYVKVRQPVKPGDPRWWFLPKSANIPAPGSGDGDGDSESDLSGYESGEGTVPSAETPPGKWYYVSDSLVSEVSEEKVLRAQAYILFYERIL